MNSININNSNIKMQVNDLYTELTGRIIDQKLGSYWTNAIAQNDKSISDLESTLLVSDDYIQKMTTLFKEQYYELIDYNLRDDVLTTFVNSYVKGKRVEIEGIRRYIVRLPAYSTKYNGLIETVYCANFKTNICPEEIIIQYIERFQNDPTYNIELLIRDLEYDADKSRHSSMQHEEIVVSTPPPVHGMPLLNTSHEGQICIPIDEFKSIYMNAVGGKTQLTDIDERLIREQPVQFMLKMSSKIQQHLYNSGASNRIALDVERLEALESVFKRPLFVQEYFKYVIESQTTNVHEFAKTVFSAHCMNFGKIRQIISEYTGEEIGEHEYVAKYLYKIDDPSFYSMIINHIVNSDQYKICMQEHLFARYHNMFDERLDDNDIVYVFNKVQEMQLALNDHEVEELLVELKKETDKIVEHIVSQFTDVLERQPEDNEILKYVAFYRSMIPRTFEDIDTMVENQLVKSLEFHDILKKRTRRAYITKHGRDIPASVLYEKLSELIKNKLDHITMKTLDATVDSCV